MTTRRGLFVAPFDALADPRIVGDLAAEAEAAGWDGFFVWDHLLYGDRVAAIADPWTCCAAIAMRTERLVFGPMVTPLPRRRPQVLARQAASLAVLSGGRFVLGLGLGDDWVGEFSAFGDEADPKVRGRMLDEGLAVLTGLLSGETVDHEGEHHAARDVRFLPAPRVPVWLAGRYGNRAPLRRAASYDGRIAASSLDESERTDASTESASMMIAASRTWGFGPPWRNFRMSTASAAFRPSTVSSPPYGSAACSRARASK